MVSPILEKGSTKRDIVLPQGQWKDGNTGIVYDSLEQPILLDFVINLMDVAFFFKI